MASIFNVPVTVASVSLTTTPIVEVPAVVGAVHETRFPELLERVPSSAVHVIERGFPFGEVASHERIDVAPRLTEAGVAVSRVMLGVLTTTLMLKVAVLDCEPSLTDTETIYVPAVKGAVHWTADPAVLESVPPVALHV